MYFIFTFLVNILRHYDKIVFVPFLSEAEPPSQIKMAQEITIFVRYGNLGVHTTSEESETEVSL